MKFFTKLRQLTLLQSAMDYLIDSKLRQLFFLFYNHKVRQGLLHCDKDYKTWRLLPLATVRAFLHIPPPSLPSLEFKGTPWLQAKTEVLLTQVCMRIFSLNYLSELRNYSLVLQSQPTSKDKKGRSPMNTLKLISIMKSMLLKTKWTHLSPVRWYRSLTGIRRWEFKNCLNIREQLSWRALNAVLLPVKFPLCIIFKHFYLSCLGDYFCSGNPPQFIGR